MGYLDKDGYLYLTDRKSFMIVSGGVNISSQEIEHVISSHPEVRDVAVFGVPNAEFGEEVKAVVQLERPISAGPKMEQEILEYCREHLARFKCPRTVDFDSDLPRLDNGKLFKQKLRETYWRGHQTSIS